MKQVRKLTLYRPATYEIKVPGQIGTSLSDWVEGMTIVIDIEGDGFLYNQVRAMVGTLVEIGRGHWPSERVLEVLESRDRSLAGPTAPARGLCLQWVRYDHQQEPPNGP